MLDDVYTHIEDVGVYIAYNGKLWLDLGEQHNIVIVNREPKCEGKILRTLWIPSFSRWVDRLDIYDTFAVLTTYVRTILRELSRISRRATAAAGIFRRRIGPVRECAPCICKFR